MGGFLLMLLGLFQAFFPYPAWYLSTGWRIRDAEPSEAALIVNRVVGAIAVVVGLVIMVSSCSLGGGGSSGGYTSTFQQRLIAGEVQEIKMITGAQTVLAKDEVAQAVDLMAHAPMEAFKLDTIYGGRGEATIVYADGTTDELLLFGPSGHIELHPRSDGSRAYSFQSDELESLFRQWISRSEQS